jgi:hypothetical protein
MLDTQLRQRPTCVGWSRSTLPPASGV